MGARKATPALRRGVDDPENTVGWRRGGLFPPHAHQGADTGPETSEADAPPEPADRQANRMWVGHRGTEEATCRPQDDSAEPKADAPVEPEPERVLALRLLGRADAFLPIPLTYGEG